MTVRLFHADFINAIEAIEPESVDMICADPPYGQTALEWDEWPSGWPEAVARALKPSGSMWVFGTLRMFMWHWSEFSNWHFAQDIVWEKHNGSSVHSDRFRRVHEQAAHFYRGAWKDVWKGRVVTHDAKARSVNRSGSPAHLRKMKDTTYRTEEGGERIMRSVIYARSQHGNAVHPTQKPEAIVEPLILNACPPGGVVLDPFAGSGTTGAVAARLGRSAILIERDDGFAAKIQERFNGDLALPRLSIEGGAA